MEAAQQPQGELLRVGDVEARPADRLVTVDGEVLSFSRRELGLLSALMRNAGRIVPREELYATVWGAELRPGDRSVDVYVHKLRTKLDAVLPGWRYIHTHFGFGYRFSAERSHPFHMSDTGP